MNSYIGGAPEKRAIIVTALLLNLFGAEGRHVVQLALDYVEGLGHSFIGVEHLFIGLTKIEGGLAVQALRRQGCNPDSLRDRLKVAAGSWPRTTSFTGPA